MNLLSRFALLSVLFIGGCHGQGNATALEALLARQLPFHADKFVFHLQYETVVNMKTSADLDTFTIFDGAGDGKIHIECSTKSACSRGVYTYPTPASTINSTPRYFLAFSCLPGLVLMSTGILRRLGRWIFIGPAVVWKNCQKCYRLWGVISLVKLLCPGDTISTLVLEKL